MQDQELLRAMRTVEDQLIEEFGERISKEEIKERTRASFRQFHRARIKTFVPIFVHREVREQLRTQ